MLVKVFDLKESDIFNHYVAEYHDVRHVPEVGTEIEIVTEKNEIFKWQTDLYGLQIEASG